MPDSVVEILGADGAGPFLFVCEHAANAFPDRWGDLGLDPATRETHVAWDPGALDLARGLARRLDSPLVAGRVSRLVYDCNRPPDSPSAMPGSSEVYEIPGNRSLAAAERLARTEAVYLPFQTALTGQLARMLALGRRPVLVTVHSFTPVWFGQPRPVEFGIIHDVDPSYAQAVADAAARRQIRLRTELNRPYSAADGVAHTLKLHATPHGLAHAMLEVRNDLLARPGAAAEMAETLAPVLGDALDALARTKEAV